MYSSRTSSHAAAPRAHGVLSHVVSWATLAALLGASWEACRATHQRRTTAKPRAKPEREQVWEDEGGQNQMPKSPPS